jgi:hypothetical protein
MKLKSKLILAATSMLVISGAAASTSAFAWYNAARQASLSVSTISAKTETTNLSIAYNTKATGDTIVGTEVVATQDELGNVVDTVTNTKKLTDVSGYGNGTFVKPMISSTAASNPGSNNITTGDVAGWWANEKTYQDSNAGYIWYHKMTFTFTATGANNVAVYLSPKSTCTATASESAANVNKSVRFSIIPDTATDPTIYGNIAGDATPKYWTASGNTAVEHDVTAATPFTNTYAGVLNPTFFAGNEKAAADMTQKASNASSYTNASFGYVFDLVPGTPKDIVIYVWIEGTDSNTYANLASVADSTFNLSMKFYTVTVNDIAA